MFQHPMFHYLLWGTEYEKLDESLKWGSPIGSALIHSAVQLATG